jgi:transcriptional regulator with PAS, ATPase and Fis domain
MENRILFGWLGTADLRAASDTLDAGLGPVAQAIDEKPFEEVVLLNNWDESAASHYLLWLQQRTSIPVTIHQVSLSGPTNFGEIYKAASEVISSKAQKYGPDAKLVFHLSPGTPAMAAVWILLAKTRFPAELIESSKKHGVQTVIFPFDISADFIPDLLRKSDRTLERLSASLPNESPQFSDIIYRSKEMERVILRARLIAPRSIPVLIEGESGTGKELFARAIHDGSPRRDKSFIALNCGAIPPELVESELFGHQKGSFTGAVTARIGHFEAANKGTIFLDEIGDLPKQMQVKLLRTLQESEITRIGENQSRKIDVRVIAATNKNLINEVADGYFREDLFYRLAVAVIRLPPLREREGDISLLIDRFMERINSENSEEAGFDKKKICASAKNLLLRHSWPGNVRELENTLTRAAVWSLGKEITGTDIREALISAPNDEATKRQILDRPLEQGINLIEIIKTVAIHYLKRGLQKAGGNKTEAARILGLPSYQTLTNWLKKYGLE